MSLRIVIASILLLASVLPAMAQGKKQGYIERGRDRYTLFLFGDSFAGGMWAGLNRLARNHPRIALNGRYREGSGLARPQIYDWRTRLPRTLDTRKIDIAIVFLGSNDVQAMRVQGAILAFDSPEWRIAYRNAVANMMQQFKSRNIAVYWMEMPPVARPGLDGRLKIVAKIQREEAEKLGIRYVAIRKYLTTSNDQYTDRGASVFGNVVRLRSRNGVRFIKAGNDKIASIALRQIETDIEIADGQRPVSDFPPPGNARIAATSPNTYDGPVFAFPGVDNGVTGNIIRPENLPGKTSARVAVVDPRRPTFSSPDKPGTKVSDPGGLEQLDKFKNTIKKGTPAYDLYDKGIWPKTAAGRLDDFARKDN